MAGTFSLSEPTIDPPLRVEQSESGMGSGPYWLFGGAACTVSALCERSAVFHHREPRVPGPEFRTPDAGLK